MFTLAKHSASILALLVASAATTATAQAPGSAVDKLFASYDKRDSPGCAVAVLEGDKTVFAKGYGMASLEHDVPITPTTAFYAASVSKQFTAFAVAMLSKQGKLSLDDDIRKWIPEVPDFGKTITIRHLIHHTSGIRDYFGLLGMMGWPSDGPVTEAQFLDLVHRQKSLNFDPGTRSLYSNSGYVLLSILVKRVSGQSLREFADASIFLPLGMTNSHFRDDHTALVKNRALAYSPRQNDWQLNMPGFDVVGDGGLFTTVEDLLKWARNSDDHKVGGNDLAALVLTRGRLGTGDSIPYAFGLSLGTYRGLPIVEHGGAYGGYRTHLLRFPTQRVAVATLCNASNANAAGLSQQVAAVFLGSRLAAAPSNAPTLAASTPAVQLPREQLDRYAGAYWDAKSEALIRVEARSGALAVVGTQSTLVPITDNRFRLSTGPTELTFVSEAGGGMRLVTTPPAGEATTYQRMPPARVDAATLAEYVADYVSSELNTTWSIVAKDGGLAIRRQALPDQKLEPGFLDAFGSPAGVLRFVRGSDGRVTAFIVGAGRVTGFRFDARR